MGEVNVNEKLNPNSYYSCDALLRRQDINGNTPEIYCVCGNRSGGKTTSFSKKVLQDWLDNKVREVGIIVRYGNELPGIAESFFNGDFVTHFFPNLGGTQCNQEVVITNCAHKITLGDRTFGWVLSLNAFNKIKKHSNKFNKIDCLFFDEFMPEDERYLSYEIHAFKSLHTSIARGYGQPVRYVPVYMMSNLVSIINPYFMAWGIASRLTRNTRFIRGKGVVLEQNFNKTAAKKQSESAFLSAFGDDEYYTEKGYYLQDSNTLIEKCNDECTYSCTFRYNGKNYAIKRSSISGIYYVNKKVNLTCPMRIAVTRDDMLSGFYYKGVMVNRVAFYKGLFSCGMLRFEDQECKDAAFNFLC